MTARRDPQPAERWRLLIVGPSAEQILVRTGGPKFALPEITTPVAQRIAASLNRTVKRELGMLILALYEIPCARPACTGAVFYHAAVATGSREDIPRGTSWAALDFLRPDSFNRNEDFAAIDTLRSLLKENPDHQPFLKPDCFHKVTLWVDECLASSFLRRTGPFEQLNASSTFSLMRFETSGPAVWFKAVGPPNTHEFPVTLALARTCPAYLPKMLATRADWNAWLAEEVSGPCLSEATNVLDWKRAAESLACLQALALGIVEEAMANRARDLRLCSLLPRVAPFFRFLKEAAANSADSERFADLDWYGLCSTITDTLTILDELGLPETIGHMDLNPRNIVCSDPFCVFLDWAEAFVGCPLFSLEYLVEHFRQAFSANPSLETQVRQAYLGCWQHKMDRTVFERAQTLSPLGALFGYASTLWASMTEQNTLEVPQRAYLLQLARKLARIAQEARAVCS
jgi:hypothetical protein